MTEQEKRAWMAGFIDGEGWIGIGRQIRKNRPSTTYRTGLKISNTKIESLKLFKVRYGGIISKGKGAYQWYCPTISRKKLLTDIEPFLIIKRKQARLLLDFMERYNLQKTASLRTKELYYQKAKQLNKNKYRETDDGAK